MINYLQQNGTLSLSQILPIKAIEVLGNKSGTEIWIYSLTADDNLSLFSFEELRMNDYLLTKKRNDPSLLPMFRIQNVPNDGTFFAAYQEGDQFIQVNVPQRFVLTSLTYSPFVEARPSITPFILLSHNPIRPNVQSAYVLNSAPQLKSLTNPFNLPTTANMVIKDSLETAKKESKEDKNDGIMPKQLKFYESDFDEGEYNFIPLYSTSSRMNRFNIQKQINNYTRKKSRSLNQGMSAVNDLKKKRFASETHYYHQERKNFYSDVEFRLVDSLDKEKRNESNVYLRISNGNNRVIDIKRILLNIITKQYNEENLSIDDFSIYLPLNDSGDYKQLNNGDKIYDVSTEVLVLIKRNDISQMKSNLMQEKTQVVLFSESKKNNINKPYLPIITKYNSHPSLEEMRTFEIDQLRMMKSFSIENDHGKIIFYEIDVIGVNFDEDVALEQSFININNSNEKLSKTKAIIYLYNFDTTGKGGQNEDKSRAMKEYLQKENLRFISFDNNTLVFAINELLYK